MKLILVVALSFGGTAWAATPIHMHLNGKYNNGQILKEASATSRDINGANGTNFTFIDVENDLKNGCKSRLMKMAVKTMASSHNFPSTVEINSLVLEQGRLSITWTLPATEQACTYKWSDARQDYCWRDSCLK